MATGTVDRAAVDAAHEEAGTRPEGAADDLGASAPVELLIDVGGQMSMVVGGKKATSSSLRIVGGKVDVAGALDKGEKLVLRLEVDVTSVSFVDKRDPKTHQVTGCERQHKAHVTAIRVLEPGDA